MCSCLRRQAVGASAFDRESSSSDLGTIASHVLISLPRRACSTLLSCSRAFHPPFIYIITTPTMKVAVSALLIGAVAAAGIPQQQPLQAAKESVLGAGTSSTPQWRDQRQSTLTRSLSSQRQNHRMVKAAAEPAA